MVVVAIPWYSNCNTAATVRCLYLSTQRSLEYSTGTPLPSPPLSKNSLGTVFIEACFFRSLFFASGACHAFGFLELMSAVVAVTMSAAIV